MAAPDLKTLGRYNIERVLGKGAMGVVYEGVDPRLGRRVAIKTILKSHLDDDTAKDFAMRFVREAQAVARLNHPNIVQVYDFGEEGDIAYLVMEFIRGKELKNFFDANERFDIKEAVRIMCELCEALDFAHHAGIVHRDIKPANVMLDHQARTKLTDFGVARVQDTDKTSVERTQAGTMVGTPAYMSPEQITGGNIDRRTDVFSAGIILYQFLTGEKPFTGSGAWTIAKKIIQEEPPLPSSLNNSVTPLFDAVVNRALAKDPEQRFQSAKDFAIALRRALDGKADEEDADRTIVGDAAPVMPPPRPAPRPADPRADSTRGGATSSQSGSSQEVELEFWRSIKDGNDPDDFELYVQQFPTGIYAALAKRKIQKLRGVAPEETSAKIKEQERREAEEAAKREAAALAKLNEEKAKLEAEYQKREAEAKAKAEAAAKEAKARAEAAEKEARAKAEAAEKARAEAIEKAKQEAAAELAKREAEYKRREAEAEAKRQAEEAKRQAETKARLEAEAKARAEAEAKAKREAEARAKAEAEAKARREAEEKTRRELEAKAKAEAEARAKREADEKAKRDAEIARREAELKKLEAEAQAVLAGDETVIARKTKASRVTAIVASVAVAVIAGSVWWFTKPDPSLEAKKVAELQAQLQEAKKREVELEKAKQRESELQKQVQLARQREEEARKSGDIAKQRELAEQTKQREAEARKQAEVTKQREAEARKQTDLAKKQQDDIAKQQKDAEAKKQREAEARKLAEKMAADKLAADRARLEKESADKLAAERDRLQKETAEKLAQERARLEKEKEALERQKTQVARAPSNVEALLQQAAAKESEGDNRAAVKLYTQAARAGSGKAAKRLGDIYTKGVDGVPRDYAESLKWYNAARVLGEEVDLQKSR
jgi:serine/threonine-protein kinase